MKSEVRLNPPGAAPAAVPVPTAGTGMDAAPSASANSPRVAIAMSGGVDSSVAAGLLVRQGYQVVGVHLKLHDLPDEEKHGKACCSLDDALDARQVCARLGIPFYVLDFTGPFRASVMDYFVQSYRAGRTPNPCVMCNRTVKSTLLLERVREFGCDALATGHYAAIRENPRTGEREIVRPVDRAKDQTYFLWGTQPEELPYLIYPLAEYEKPRVRELAAAQGLATWDKPDSQEVCFVPQDYRDFLRPRLPEAQPGDVVDRSGRMLGRHQGLAFYTIGQRRGLGISSEHPLYVVALDMERNRVVVGPEQELYGRSMTLSGVNWISGTGRSTAGNGGGPAVPERTVRALVKVRYAHAGTPALISAAADGSARVRFEEPVRAIAPGQAAVFYDGDVLLGGGWIESTP